MNHDTDGMIHLSYTGTCTMELTPEFEKTFRETFNLELDMLRGTREPLPDGRTRFTFTITSEEQGRLLVEFIRKLPNHHETWLN